MQKKLLLPLLLFVAGAGLLAFGWFRTGDSSLQVKIKPASYIMPAAYKVYANPDVLGGRYNLFKAIIENTGDAPISNMKVEYRIPKYIDEWTEAPSSAYVLPGQSIVVTAYPSFDQSITEKSTQSKEKAEIRITYGPKGNTTEQMESFMFTMMAINDFAYTDMPASEIVSFRDIMQNDALSACFVTAEDPAVKYYTENIQNKILKGETAGVTRTAQEGVRFLQGIYEATLRSGMVYSSTQCVPSSTGDISTLVQRVRLPREVINGNTGLCIELSFLYASILRNAGMDPVIFYIPGHAYPGIRVDGQYYAIEATAIGGQGMGGSQPSSEALKMGMKQLEEFFQRMQMGDERYYIVDVNQLYQEGIIPMELKDDGFTRNKIDEITKLWDNPGQSAPPPQTVANTGGNGGNGGNDNNRNPGGGGGGGNNTSGFTSYSGNIRFSYPQGSQVLRNPYPQLPMLIAVMRAPNNSATAEVYDFPGFNDIGSAFQALRQSMNAQGLDFSVSQTGNHNGYTLFNGQTFSNGQAFPWIAAFRSRNNRVEGLIVGSMAGNTQLAAQIVSTIH